MADQAAVSVLNAAAASSGADRKQEKKLTGEESVQLSRSLQKLIRRIKGEFLMNDYVDYAALKSSSLYSEFLSLTQQLRSVNLDSYSERQRKAFFINVYNTLTIHGVISQERLPESVLKVKQFWKVTAYDIGGLTFSLDDIEHGILRGNQSHPASSQPHHFAANDPRAKYAADKVDPRIHFALNCGAKSCPVISSYSEDNLDKALDDAAKLFCSQEVIVLPKNEEVYISKIFDWYERDFGKNDLDAIRWTLDYLEPGKRAELGILLQGIQSVGSGKIVYNEYDWTLNSSMVR